MKPIFLTITFLSFLGLTSAQQLPDAVVSSTVPIVWLGMDFSKAVYVGPADKFDAKAFKDTYAYKANYIVATESKKFDLQTYLQKGEVSYKTQYVNDANSNADLIPVLSDVANTISEADLPAVVSKYNFEESGVGVMVIVSCMNKASNTETAFFTYIDLTTKEIIYTQKVEGKSSGFGLAAFWANPMMDMLKTMNQTITTFLKAQVKQPKK